MHLIDRQYYNLNAINSTEYVDLAKHGMIASNRTAALISVNGTIDWACLPDFDSDPIFDSILDHKKGGYFKIQPKDTEGVDCTQYYIPNTNVLVTEFVQKGEMILRITDFIPSSPYVTLNSPEIHRYVEIQSEEKEITCEIDLSFHFDKKNKKIVKHKNGFVFKSPGSDSVGVASDFLFTMQNGKLVSNLSSKSQVSGWIVLFYGMEHVMKPGDYKSYDLLENTIKYQKEWVNKGNYPVLHNSEVIRSALVLKGLIYEPTGLMVAAPTTSLPEYIRGDRNFDYRFCWVRDVSYVIESLTMLDYKDEAVKFLYDVMERVKADGNLKTIYPIKDKSSIQERIIDYEGYCASSPVRLGNAASFQLQIDEYGSLINAIYHLSKAGGPINSYLWDFVTSMLNKLTDLWKNGDSSIWEFRTGPLHYTYSKVIAWSAFKRGVEMAKALKLSAPIDLWKSHEERIKNDILEHGFNKEINSFTQYYGSEIVDASLLRLPLLGFLPPDDPRIVGTMDRIERDLMVDSYLFKRYNIADNFNFPDNGFVLLSFWYVEDLIIMGKIKKAKHTLDKILSHTNHVGLLSEEIDFNTGKLVGNFPQALSHLGLIRSAVRLNRVSKNNSNIDHELRFTLF